MIREELGVNQQLVNKSEIHDLEPNIKPFYHAGVYYPYARHTKNPKKILLKFFELFLKKGGKFNKLNVKDIDFDNEYRSPGWERFKKNKMLKWKK